METSVVEVGPINAANYSPLDGDHILKDLDRKRRSLDLEIAQYKLLKEEEYRQYELVLRKKDQEKASDDKASQCSNDGDEMPTNALDGTNEDDIQATLVEENETEGLQVLLETKTSENGQTSKLQAIPSIPTTESSTPDREREFHGLFTPRFLPLLDHSSRFAERGGGAIEPSPPSSYKHKSHKHRSPTPAPLSSSATLPTTVFDPLRSPLQSTKLSNSAPRPIQLAEHRTSSSHSDGSAANRRSSLRQPKAPKSPKHVLFAIDNTVLSPSTSPIAQRANNEPPIPFSGLKDLVAPNKAIVDDDMENENGSAKQIENIGGASRSFNDLSAISSSPLSSVRSYHNLVEPLPSTKPARTEDFEQVIRDDDALFSFDEDVDVGDLTVDDEEKDEDERTPADGKEPPLSPGFPHTGSLPIEIKWPVRQDPRN